MRVLFVKDQLCYPRSSGHDVHTFHMMQAMSRSGHEVHLLTKSTITSMATKDSGIAGVHTMEEHGKVCAQLTRYQRRFSSYWGVSESHINYTAQLSQELKCDAVVAVGLDVLPYLAGIKNAVRVWYAADEWFFHHLSQFFIGDPKSWNNLKAAFIKGLYERVFSSCVDRVWLVSDTDARYTKTIMRRIETDVIPNGVDTEHYTPINERKIPFSCVIWGRLDFGPNIDAINWFAKNVWLKVKEKNPSASFDVFGFQPCARILELAEKYGFNVTPNLPDIRKEISRRQVVVLPFVSGGGIKNKFLEAASLGMPIIGSAAAMNGLKTHNKKPMQVAKSPKDWLHQLNRLWETPTHREELGFEAREWAVSHCGWHSAATAAIESIRKSRKRI